MTDGNEAEKGVIRYYLRDDTAVNANEMKVRLLPLSLGESVATYDAPADKRIVNQFHPEANQPEIVLHTFGANDEEGMFTAVFTGIDGHGKEYREHQPKRALAKNKKTGRRYTVDYVRFMSSDYSEVVGITQAGIPAAFGKLYAVPDVTHIEARVVLKAGATAPDNILVTLQATDTPGSQVIKVPLSKLIAVLNNFP